MPISGVVPVIDNLGTTYSGCALDANQGHVLDQSMVHNTGNESVSGVKTFEDGIAATSITMGSGAIDNTSGQFSFTQGTYETYQMPSPTAELATTYQMLTSKSPVSVAQGGTGITSIADNALLMGSSGTFASITATTASTGDTIVKRNASGNFDANVITGILSGRATSCGTAGVTLVPITNNRINFGGTYEGNTRIFFGYAAQDGRSKPTDYYFGGSSGDANVYVGKLYCQPMNATTEGGEISLAAAPSGGYAAAMDVYYNTSSKVSFWRISANGSAKFTVNLSTGAHADYAEERVVDAHEPGRVYQEQDNCILTKADRRLIPGCSVYSDTYGTCLTNKSKSGHQRGDAKYGTIAVSGRVLVYPYQDRELYHAGMAVCSAPNGTVDIMSRDEIKEYPDCILGYVSGIPDENNLDVDVPLNGRIWIRLA